MTFYIHFLLVFASGPTASVSNLLRLVTHVCVHVYAHVQRRKKGRKMKVLGFEPKSKNLPANAGVAGDVGSILG